MSGAGRQGGEDRARQMLKTLAKFGKNEDGQALIESAFVLVFLVAFVFAAADYGFATFQAIEVSNAARAGADYGAQTSATAQDSSGIALAAAADANKISGLSTTSSISCICSDGSASTCANTDCSASHIEETVTVNTSASYTMPFKLPGMGSKSITLKGTASEKCAQ